MGVFLDIDRRRIQGVMADLAFVAFCGVAFGACGTAAATATLEACLADPCVLAAVGVSAAGAAGAAVAVAMAGVAAGAWAIGGAATA